MKEWGVVGKVERNHSPDQERHDHQNVSVKLPCVCVRLSSGDLFIFL